ncbi:MULTISPECIES: alkaline phosphatase [unclassified Shewanella]|uniref:alkaline phosphatase n=1 Tax=unclassified Shewanella TaxID=196818 RepID=UPI001F5349BB|nr:MULTISPECIES: alkaline phosphatase [unclassified Shewanella]MDO6620324.1 alkaline phosphatase [Shewanella sp. 6_MG-2023]MDO6638611.1 alkaline phosphatase [Shewanella sp. 5_MG-2023]MDO6679871.1 alkaline phosphatase [Shewanella sp. 4_MG-2023]
MHLRRTLGLLLSLTLWFSNTTVANELIAEAAINTDTASQTQAEAAVTSEAISEKAAIEQVVIDDPVIVAPITALKSTNKASTTAAKPKNMVIMVGDGMGPAYTSAYRYFKDNPNTQEIEQTVFDRLLVGMASTYPARSSGYVTDSAASATALATGFKTYNGAISVDENKRPLTTIMELAKAAGLSTGVAVSSQVNHATPAAFLTHNEHRKNYKAIAQSYLNTDADVILGGGQQYFSAELLLQFKDKGYQHITEFEQLDSITEPKVLGLFAPVQLPWVIDDKQGHKLSSLTKKALELLAQNDQGFVLLVEGSLIDWAGHDNDIASVMGEMDEFANAIEVVEQFVRQRKDTLMVVTADHNTGGLSIGTNGEYEWQPQLIHAINASPTNIAQQLIATDDWQTKFNQLIGFDASQEELTQLSNARMQGEKQLTATILTIIDARTNTGWTTLGHTGLDVQVFAAGPGERLFSGHQNNTDIATKMMSLLPQSQTVIISN